MLFAFSMIVCRYFINKLVPAAWSLLIPVTWFVVRDSMLSMPYAIANPSVRPSGVHLSFTRVDQSKTVEVRIMQFSPYSSLIPLVFELQVSSRNSDGIPPSGGVKQWWVAAALRETSYFCSSNAFARWLLKLDILSQLLQTYSPGRGTVAR